MRLEHSERRGFLVGNTLVNKLRIPDQIGHPFRGKSVTRSGSCGEKPGYWSESNAFLASATVTMSVIGLTGDDTNPHDS